MQNTITARRISYTWVALMVGLVAIALLVGFAAGRTSIASASTSVNSATTQVQAQPNQRLLQLNEMLYPSTTVQPNAPMEGWVNYQDQLTAKWYSVHYSITPTGPVIDETIELLTVTLPQRNQRLHDLNEMLYPSSANRDGCSLSRTEPDC